jgi:membrane protein
MNGWWGSRLDNLKKIGPLITERAKKITLPFFDGVPLYDVSVFFLKSLAKGALSMRASGIAFNFFMALFPTVIFLFTLIPYMPIPNFQEELYQIIKDLVPDAIFPAIDTTITGILKEQQGGWLSIGFFMALFFSTNGFTAIMIAFDTTIHNTDRRRWVKQKFISLILLIIMAILLSITIVLLTVGQYLLTTLKEQHILEDRFIYFLLTVVRWIIIIGLFFFSISFLYYMAPGKKTRWRFISAGGTLATILSLLTLSGFGFYINNFSQYNKLYGAIGTLLIVLILIYLMSLILLIGFELNASIHQAKISKE